MHRSNHYLFEGMRSGDLTDLILPLVSIDEYESKIDSDAIVIAFYVTDKDAADDLNRFIQRSPVEILDSDISPAPDQNGHFLVFVELLNNKTAVENILAIVEEVSPLCSIDAWDAQVRGHDEIEELDAQKLATSLSANKQHDTTQKQGGIKTSVTEGIKQSVTTALFQSDLERLLVLDNGTSVLISLDQAGRDQIRYVAVGCGDRSAMLEEGCLSDEGFTLSPASIATTNRVQRLLGPKWDVQAVGANQLWRRNDGVCVLVKPLA